MMCVPKSLDTPEKQKLYLDIGRQIKEYQGYIRHYKKDMDTARKSISRCERMIRELKAFRNDIVKGKAQQKPKQGWLKFESEE